MGVGFLHACSVVSDRQLCGATIAKGTVIGLCSLALEAPSSFLPIVHFVGEHGDLSGHKILRRVLFARNEKPVGTGFLCLEPIRVEWHIGPLIGPNVVIVGRRITVNSILGFRLRLVLVDHEIIAFPVCLRRWFITIAFAKIVGAFRALWARPCYGLKQSIMKAVFTQRQSTNLRY